jgi:ABC-type enterochelin transport system permease subunit
MYYAGPCVALNFISDIKLSMESFDEIHIKKTHKKLVLSVILYICIKTMFASSLPPVVCKRACYISFTTSTCNTILNPSCRGIITLYILL